MPNMEGPAETTGGSSSTSGHLLPEELPAKVRVHALAKLLGRSSREVLDALEQLGKPARSAQSSLDREVAVEVADALLGDAEPVVDAADAAEQPSEPEVAKQRAPRRAAGLAPVFAAPAPLFQSPTAPPPAPARPKPVEEPVDEEPEEQAEIDADADADGESEASRRRRRRGRRGRGRGKGGQGDEADNATEDTDAEQDTPAAEAEDTSDDAADEAAEDAAEDGDGTTRRRRRRRRRKGTGDDAGGTGEDDPPNTVVHVRDTREAKASKETSSDEVRSVRGSTRLEAKRQRRRDGREAGRRRVPILSESEFLARREAVDRKMVVHERGDVVQIGVTEDGVLVEHFVTSAGSGSLVGNVYLGRVQNVLPSMEAAFVDIGRGRNAVLYAGEVDWDAAGLEGKARKIEQALSTGDSVLVQVTKDPVGHKGARLTTQISLPGRFLVYVPGGGATGISRKLPDNERKRLKDVLKRIVPEDAGVIIRTASEGVSEEELGRDVRRLRAQWEVIQEKAGAPKAKAPQLLYEEPDLLIKVVRDLFTEDFSALIVQGATAFDTINDYVTHVAPDLADRLRKHVGPADVFTEHRIDEQIMKALDRKVWLPSGGYLVIDRTEAMTVIDVNTGKFTGSGGNLEETVTRNNLEAAEEIVRQLRLRDVGGIIVVDFIDMVLESNRDLVLRRLTECLGRDRTRHQVAEVTSLGLVQMTRKRVGTGLLEAFSTPCEHCRGRGVVVSTTPNQAHNGNGGNGGGNGGQHSHATPAGPSSVVAQAAAAVHAAASNGNNGHEQPATTSGSSRRSRHRNRGESRTPVEAAPEAEVTPEVTPEVIEAPEPAQQPAQEQAPEPVAEVEAPDVPLATVESPVAEDDEPDEDSSTIAVTSNGHWTVVEQPPATRVTRRPSRRAASRPAGPPASSAQPAPESDAQPADQHESAESQGEHTPV
jgi:ribonuclease E